MLYVCFQKSKAVTPTTTHDYMNWLLHRSLTPLKPNIQLLSLAEKKYRYTDHNHSVFPPKLIPSDDRECAGLAAELCLCEGAVIMLRREH